MMVHICKGPTNILEITGPMLVQRLQVADSSRVASDGAARTSLIYSRRRDGESISQRYQELGLTAVLPSMINEINFTQVT